MSWTMRSSSATLGTLARSGFLTILATVLGWTSDSASSFSAVLRGPDVLVFGSCYYASDLEWRLSKWSGVGELGTLALLSALWCDVGTELAA